MEAEYFGMQQIVRWKSDYIMSISFVIKVRIYEVFSIFVVHICRTHYILLIAVTKEQASKVQNIGAHWAVIIVGVG